MNHHKQYDHLFKFLLLGEPSVGKTCILLRYTDDIYSTKPTATIGVDFKNKLIDSYGQRVRLQIWDTVGQDRYKAVTKQFYRGANGIVFVYSLSNRETFMHVRNWIEQLRLQFDERSVKVLVGNKCDMEEERQVSYEEGKKLAEEFNMRFYETSAAKSIRVNEVFEHIVRELIMPERKKEVIRVEENVLVYKEKVEVVKDVKEATIVLEETKKGKKGCCGK